MAFCSVGSLFQTQVPAAEKARSPSSSLVDRRSTTEAQTESIETGSHVTKA